MSNTEKQRDITLFVEHPKIIHIPERLILEYESKVGPFNNLEAETLLIARDYLPNPDENETAVKYTREELEQFLTKEMNRQIEVSVRFGLKIKEKYDSTELLDVIVFELDENPKTVRVPKAIIEIFEKYSAPFTNMRASALLSAMEYKPSYDINTLTSMLLWVMKDEIAVANNIGAAIEKFFEEEH